jgi:hypothetical protein
MRSFRCLRRIARATLAFFSPSTPLESLSLSSASESSWSGSAIRLHHLLAAKARDGQRVPFPQKQRWERMQAQGSLALHEWSFSAASWGNYSQCQHETGNLTITRAVILKLSRALLQPGRVSPHLLAFASHRDHLPRGRRRRRLDGPSALAVPRSYLLLSAARVRR